jgi:hypothetical protein
MGDFMAEILRLTHTRIAGFDIMLAIAVVAAVAALGCWLWVYQALLDRRRGKSTVRMNLSAKWNPLAWLGGGSVGLFIALQVFMAELWPWSRLHWHEEMAPLLFMAACLILVAISVLVALIIGSSLSYILYPFQVMTLAVIHAGDWRDRVLMVLADVLIVVCTALAILSITQINFR